jgi:hypothetical protein
MIGRHSQESSGHGAGKAELGYLFLPRVWGFGYAAEACAAVLGWFAGERPGEPVVLKTQTANARSMRFAAKLGFTEAGRYEAYGAGNGSACGPRSHHLIEFEKEPRYFPNWLRQRVEAIVWTLKNQPGLERHGGRVPAGLWAASSSDCSPSAPASGTAGGSAHRSSAP